MYGVFCGLLAVLTQGQPVETTSKLYFTLVHALILRNEHFHVDVDIPEVLWR